MLAILEAADKERLRIGRDLHDGAQQRLVVLGHALDLALRELEADPSRAARLLSSAREQAATAGRELRELAQGLHPVSLDHGLAHALSALAGSSPLPVHLDAVPAERLPAKVEGAVWFLVSETLSNAIKHAAATELRVAVAVQDEALHVRLSDDGSGGACPSLGTGLQGLRARVEAHGVTGNSDILCRVVARVNTHLQDVINAMLHTGAIQRSTSSISMTRQIPYRIDPLIEAAGELD